MLHIIRPYQYGNVVYSCLLFCNKCTIAVLWVCVSVEQVCTTFVFAPHLLDGQRGVLYVGKLLTSCTCVHALSISWCHATGKQQPKTSTKDSLAIPARCMVQDLRCPVCYTVPASPTCLHLDTQHRCKQQQGHEIHQPISLHNSRQRPINSSFNSKRSLPLPASHNLLVATTTIHHVMMQH